MRRIGLALLALGGTAFGCNALLGIDPAMNREAGTDAMTDTAIDREAAVDPLDSGIACPPCSDDAGLCAIACGQDLSLDGQNVASDGRWVYWSTTKGIVRAERDGGSPVIMPSPPSGALLVGRDGCTYSTEFVVTGSVFRSCDGGVFVAIASGQRYPISLTMGADSTLYWSNYALGDAGSVAACAPQNCLSSLSTVAVMDSPSLTAAASTDVYWGASGPAPQTLFSCPTTGCDGGPSKVAGNLSGVQDLLADDTGTLYWATTAGIFTCAVAPTCTPANVWSGGQARALARDGSTLYFLVVNPTRTLHRCILPGCTMDMIVASGFKNPIALALDSTFVFVADLQGVKANVWRTPR